MEIEDSASLSLDKEENINDMSEEKSTDDTHESDNMPVATEKTEDTVIQESRSNLNLNDSDSDEEILVKKPQKKTKHKQLKALLDSDSEDEDILAASKESSKVDKRAVSTSQHAEDNDSHSGEEISEKDKSLMTSTNLFDRYKALIDSDSEDEAPAISYSHKETEKPKHVKTPKSEQKKRKGSQRVSKSEAMKQIHSETQRLIRESAVSLPYHVPKQRTIEEFLNRKKVINTLPKAPTMAAKLKMSSAIVNQVLEEKEKEAMLFYKSSDSEEESEETSKSSQREAAGNLPVKELVTVADNIPIEETQKIMKNVCDSRNKKEILHQGDVDLGMPRKLFQKDEDEADKEGSKDASQIRAHGSLPRKLLNSLVDNRNSEAMEIDNENRSDDDIIKETVDEMLSTVEQMMQEHQIPTEQSTEADEITDTPHISKDEMSMLLLKDDINESTSNVSNTEKDICSEKDIIELDKVSTMPVTSAKSKLLLNLPPIQPKLRGAPGSVIDLSQDVKPDRKGINQLLDRFFCKHSKVSKPVENVDNLTVVQVKETPEGPVSIKESLPYKLPTVTHEDPELSKPGAKLLRLQQELKHQMALKRDEEWKEKERQEREEDEMFGDEEFEEDNKKVYEDESVNGDDNKEDEEVVEDEEDEEDICDLDDDHVKEKKRKKCEFADDEAEVSDGDENESEDEDESADGSEDEGMNLQLDEDDDEDEENSNSTTDLPKARKLQRIIKPFEEDSCQSNANNDETDDGMTTPSNLLPRVNTDVDMFEMDNDNSIPISQPHIATDNVLHSETPISQAGNLDLGTPITQLTPLNVPIKSTSDKLGEDDLKISLGSISIGKGSVDSTDLERKNALQRKLFTESNQTGSEDGDSKSSSEICKSTENASLHFDAEQNMTESQLLDLCSGSFTTQAEDVKKLEVESSGNNDSISKIVSSAETITNNTQKSQIGARLTTKFRVVSSDEEEDVENAMKSKKLSRKRKVKQLQLSDDEEDAADSDLESENEEENDMEDDEKYVDYDSEENEVVVVPKKDMKRYAAHFLEKEAELSESDWEGSDDEDEKDLDKLEVEDGDEEEIDEDDVRKELGRHHVKHLIDEDQRDVRMLKELLFEDGDLHTDGSGRERKFRWRNIDKLGDDQSSTPVSDDKDGWVDVPEDENEIEWRKIRHEREKFLAERMKTAEDDIENDLQDSQIFQLGMKVLQKLKSNPQKKEKPPPTSTDNTTHSELQHTFSEMLDVAKIKGKSETIQSIIRKRSLLARGEESLARLAMIAKQSDPSVLPVNTRNFIFTTVKPSEDQSEDKKEEPQADSNYTGRKRKAFTHLTPRSAKKTKPENSSRNGQAKKRL